MITVAANEAKTHLSTLLQQVKEKGERVYRPRQEAGGELVPLNPAGAERPKVDDMLNKLMHIPAEAFAPLSPDELRRWSLG